MSEKHLTKSAWETEAKKHHLDDKTLSKALGTYEKCNEEDLPAQEKALDEVDKAAGALKKNKAYKEVADYLDEVADACEHAQKELAKRIEEEEAEEEDGGGDEELAELTKDLAKQLKAAMGQVKGHAPGDPIEPGVAPEPGKQLKFLAYVAGGATSVIVAKRVGGSTRKLAAKLAGVSGGKYHSGDCIYEKNAYTFVLDQPPGGFAHKVSVALQEETGQKYKVRVRSIDGLVESDDETDAPPVDPNAQTPPPPPPGPPSPLARELAGKLQALKADLQKAAAAPSGHEAMAKFTEAATLLKERHPDEAAALLPEVEQAIKKALAELAAAPTGDSPDAAFKQRLAALMPAIKEAIAAGNTAGTEIKLKASEAGAKAKQHDFDGANVSLDEIEALLGGNQPVLDEALFKQRLTALTPKIKDAMATQSPEAASLRAKVGEASAFAKQHDFAKANGALSEIEIMLGAPGLATGSEKKFSLVDLQKSRLSWVNLRSLIQSQLQELEAVILQTVRAHNADETAEDEFDEAAVASGVKDLSAKLGALDERLIDKLDEALNAQTDDVRRARHAEAAVIIKEYQAFAASSETLATVDLNGFTQSSIQSAVQSTLAELAAKF